MEIVEESVVLTVVLNNWYEGKSKCVGCKEQDTDPHGNSKQ